jgi:hypothetical protein
MTLKKYEFDGLTGQGVLRDMTPEELENQKAYAAKVTAYKKAEEKVQSDKEALLAKLGITAEEAQLLLK